ncbi:MAG: sugar nucleotide-binding protein, partial [Pseudomonadota bacterium]
MRVLITGGSGQVGTHLAAEAAARGWDILTPGRDELDLTALSDGIELNLRGIDGVLNAAAYTAVDKAESEEGEAHHLNTVVPGLLADLCKKEGIPFVHYST